MQLFLPAGSLEDLLWFDFQEFDQPAPRLVLRVDQLGRPVRGHGDDRVLDVERVVRQRMVVPHVYGLLGHSEFGEGLLFVDFDVVDLQFLLELLDQSRSLFLEADPALDHHGTC